MTKLGYARASAFDDDIRRQEAALRKAGCSIVFTEREGAAQGPYRELFANRPGLARAMSRLKSGDTLVVWRLDTLAGSFAELFAIMNLLSNHEIGFQSLTDNLDTEVPGGQLIYHVMASFADFEKGRANEDADARMRTLWRADSVQPGQVPPEEHDGSPAITRRNGKVMRAVAEGEDGND